MLFEQVFKVPYKYIGKNVNMCVMSVYQLAITFFYSFSLVEEFPFSTTNATLVQGPEQATICPVV